MKKVGILMMVMLVSVALLCTGCGGNDNAQQQQEQHQQQDGQQNTEGMNDSNQANPASADVQDEQMEVVTVEGIFQGLADGHSAEITIEGEPVVFQFFDEDVATQLEMMESETPIRFDVTTDTETGVKTIVKLYE